MPQRLFVYGTLGPDGPNRHIVSEIGGTWLPASVRGRLRDSGWGARIGYPVIVLDESGDVVTGHLFVSDNLQDHWEDLDAFEGDEYERVRTSVQRSDNTSVEAFIYVLRE